MGWYLTRNVLQIETNRVAAILLSFIAWFWPPKPHPLGRVPAWPRQSDQGQSRCSPELRFASAKNLLISGRFWRALRQAIASCSWPKRSWVMS